jgi:hypothetical protein
MRANRITLAKMPVANLVRHFESGIHYARIRIRGKLIWKPLQTGRIGAAKLRLTDFPKKERPRAAVNVAALHGKVTFAQALETYATGLTPVKQNDICAA